MRSAASSGLRRSPSSAVGANVSGSAKVVELLLLEGEPARLRLLDDRDLDLAHLRHLLAAHVLHQRVVPRRFRHREVPGEAPILGIRLEHDLRAAGPARQHVRARADRMAHRVVGVALDHLARDDPERDVRGDEQEVVVGLLEPEAQRVAVDDLDPRDLRVVVELPALLRRRGVLVQPDDLALEQERVRGPVLRIQEPEIRVDDVLRDELALLALEHRVRREVDALAQLERVGLAVVGDLRHRLGQHRDELRRPREVIVGQQPLEDALEHRRGIEIRDPHRVEAVLARGEAYVQDLVRVRCRDGGRRKCQCGGNGDGRDVFRQPPERPSTAHCPPPKTKGA